MSALRLTAISTHPIQYQAPYFRGIAQTEGIDFLALYCFRPTPAEQGEGFDTAFFWDVPLLEGYRWKDLPVRRRGTGSRGFFTFSAVRIRRVLRESNPDVLLITGWHAFPLVQALMAGRRLGIPTLLRGESNDLRPRPFWVRRIHRLLFSRVSAFLAIGKANRRLYEENGVSPNRILDAPYSVENERFGATSRALRSLRKELRHEWAISQTGFCFLFAGKLQQKKRPLDLLPALERVVSSHPDAHLLVVGSGELECEMRRIVSERRLPVTFAGFLNQTEIPRAYAATDALVLPSGYGETWGLVVNEAMAAGIPAIVSDRVGCREDLIDEGISGLSFPFGDVSTLAARMVELAENPVRAADMGAAAQLRVQRDYSMERAVEGTITAARAVGGKGVARE